MPSPTPNSFVFFTCQPGAESALKSELVFRQPDLRLAFSRPGFVSFKCPGSTSNAGVPLPVFARTRSVSLGRVSRDSLAEAARAVWQLDGVGDLVRAESIGGLHAWERDTQLPGEGGFEPTITPLAEEVRKALRNAATEIEIPLPDSVVAPRGAVVLDVVLVEPGEWYVGWHRGESRTDRWPGAILPVAAPENAISRAYLKMEEALKWSALPAERGDLWVELGCAPGGSCQALVDRGFRVLGVDPAEVEEPLANHPRFTHLRKRATEVRRTEFVDAKWLSADLNVAPQYTLDAVEEIVASPAASIRGLVLTLKLASWDSAAPERLQEYIDRVQSWGFRDVRLRQLVHNRRELCLVALPSRGQRRVTRRRKRRGNVPPNRSFASQVERSEDVRFDAPTQIVPRHHFR